MAGSGKKEGRREEKRERELMENRGWGNAIKARDKNTGIKQEAYNGRLDKEGPNNAIIQVGVLLTT